MHAERARGVESEGDGKRHGWDAWGWKPSVARGVRDEGATHGGSRSVWDLGKDTAGTVALTRVRVTRSSVGRNVKGQGSRV